MAQSYHDFILNLLKVAYNNIKQHVPFDQDELGDVDARFIEDFKKVIIHLEEKHGDRGLGESVISRMPVAYTDLVPLIPRDLFWYFGGSCLHYMPDEEIAIYQSLDEAMYDAENQGEAFNYEDMRAKALGLN